MLKNCESNLELIKNYYDEDFYLTNPRENYDEEYYYAKFFGEECKKTLGDEKKGFKGNACTDFSLLKY